MNREVTDLPSIASPASLDTDFPAANNLSVPLTENPNPEVDVRVRKTWKNTGQAGCPQNSSPDVSTEQLNTHDIICIRMIRELENRTFGGMSLHSHKREEIKGHAER